MTVTRVALVGLGMASKPHLEALKQLEGKVEIAGVYNRSPGPALKVAEQYGVPVFDSIDAITADESVTAVILVTPPDQREALVRTFAAAGKHILTEKPIERSSEQASALVEICEAASVNFGVVFQHRFRAGALRLTEIMNNGLLGEIASVRVQVPWWREQSYYDVPGRGSYARDGGGVLISQAIHVLDLMLSLTGPAQSVQALCATTPIHQLEAEDFAAGCVRFASGAVGSIVATTVAFPGGAETLCIDGTLGSAILEAGKLSVHWRDGSSEELGETTGTGGGADPMAFPCDWHRDLIEDFVDSIQAGVQPRISGREGLRVHNLIDALVASSRQGQQVDVKS
ncbi:Gfo/Idh/MocA family protein [Granulosicoccus antarcticus]|uniref:D-xylose dehydrogenase n=1 Tax=Granulosicoccus antarcticus IMCC3135 TaxID=1192854 RepID=A0A2Z2NK07_9GAMM|nr:Gfo/Idh/MocA family oxidoreductase [Granulosicoccus antarcticus]ASJ71453.1 D-xylose dehydrogenase [Granulosicoccus antarcticus IMCC3135]